MEPRSVLLTALIPPAGIIPLFGAFMCVTHRIERGGWLPGSSPMGLVRSLTFAYGLAILFHAAYGSLIVLLARAIGLRHFMLWTGLYAALPLILVVCLANTSSDFWGGLIYCGFATAIGMLSWPFVSPWLTAR